MNESGKKYFNVIREVLEARGMDEMAYSVELSRLANHYALYEEANEKARERENEEKPGFYNEFDNGTVQVNAFFTISEKSSSAIDKLGAKFGLTPQDFEKIKDSVKKDEETDPSDEI